MPRSLRVGAGLSSLALLPGTLLAPPAHAAPPPPWRPLPVPWLVPFASFEGIAAPGPKDVWAVGTQGRHPILPDNPRPAVLRWNGAWWSRYPMPGWRDRGGIKAVSASSPKNVWVVGGAGQGSVYAAQWNGSAWKRVTIPGAGTPGFIHDIDTGGGGVWIAWEAWDTQSPADKRTSAIVQRIGGRWKRYGLSGRRLGHIRARTAKDAWAVGADTVRSHAAVSHWNGKTWRSVPIRVGVTSELTAVLPLGAKNVWVAGNISGADPDPGLVMQWNGRSWKRHVLPKGTGMLNALIRDRSGNIWASGTTSGWENSLLLRYNGRAWAKIPTVAPSGNGSRWMSALAASPGGRLWATVSHTGTPDGYSPYVLRSP